MTTETRFAHASCLNVYLSTTIALLVLCGLASTAAAGPTSDTAPVTRSAKVSLADLDLSRPDGARAARERLRETARRLCAQVADDLDLAHQPNFVACVDETLTAALRQAAAINASAATTKAAQTKVVSQACQRSP